MTTNFTTFQSQLLNMVAAVSSDSGWTTELPLVIDRAEQRIYRDLDLLGTRVTDTSGSLTAFTRLFTLPAGSSFIVVEQVSVSSAIGGGSSNFTRTPLTRCSPVLIDMTYPANNTFNGLPQWFAMIDNKTISVGPVPDLAYPVEVRGTQRPTVLSSANSSTILTQLLPDLFFAAAMVEAGAFMRFTEPTVFQTWLEEYNALKAGALVEEQRKKFYAEGWTDKQPSPIATPPRA